jgi:hypothetical protein
MTATEWLTALAAFAATVAVCGIGVGLALRGVILGWRLVKFALTPRRHTQQPYGSSDASSFAPPEQDTSAAILEAVNSLTAVVSIQGRQIAEMHTAFQYAQAQRARSSQTT